MEIQLQELIEQIKKDGVNAAEDKAADILKNADAEAKKIIDDAKEKAKKLISDAKSENERLVQVSEDAIKQASRNLLISFRESVTRELDAIIGDNVKAAFSAEKLSELIIKLTDEWTKRADAEEITVILGSEDLKVVEENLLSALKKKLSDGVTLKASDDIEGGFRISADNGNAYYDYSAEAVTEMLSLYLNPRVTMLMKEAEE